MVYDKNFTIKAFVEHVTPVVEPYLDKGHNLNIPNTKTAPKDF